jgi:uncharacterized protein (TIGR03435 family)
VKTRGPERTTVTVFWCLALTLPPLTYAQSPEFDVASVREHRERSAVSFGPSLGHGTFRATNVSLKSLILAAYGVTRTRLNGPDWLDHQTYDISAKSPDGVPDTEMKPMLQALLRDRFDLRVHSEMKEMLVYYLRVPNGGPKMSVYPAPEKEIPFHPPGAPMIRGAMKMSQLCRALSTFADRPVLDQTQLTERYNFALVFAAPLAQPTDAAADAPDMFVAIQEQLGLRLQSGKESLEVIIVDKINRTPSQN